jgi:transaldolase
VMYIEPLIGPETVTTVPDETIAAFADHGESANSLALDMEGAHDVVDRLAAIGIDTEKVADELQIDGVKKFEDAFRNLTANLEKKRKLIEEAVA